MDIQTIWARPAKPRGVSAKPEEHIENRAARRLKGYLKRKFPHMTAENVAAILRISVRQAYDQLSGRARWTWRHILKLVGHFKGDFVHSVMHPLTGEDGQPRFRLRAPKLRKAVVP